VAWDDIARERGTFQEWLRAHVLSTRDHAELLRRLQVAA